MPTLDEVLEGKGGGDYHGPTNYKTPDGKVHQINKFHQPRNVLDDIHFGCQSRDFIGVQLVGGMGSGNDLLGLALFVSVTATAVSLGLTLIYENSKKKKNEILHSNSRR